MKPMKTWEESIDRMVCEQFAVAYVALRWQIRENWEKRHDPWWRAWIRERIIMLRRNKAVRRAYNGGLILFER